MSSLNNPQLQLAYDFVEYTNKNIFLTGKAGTGKTTFLLNLKEKSPKRMIVVAPTGVAAINAGGVTIHSFFQLPFGPHIPSALTSGTGSSLTQNPATQNSMFRFSQEKINIIKSLDLLVIDEISMVRSDLLDGIDEVLRKYKDRYKPFGGVQLLMIGDLQQLAPIVKEEEWEILREYYDTMFFFGSRALQRTQHVSIELKHIYRQSDSTFIGILNKVRESNIDPRTLEQLNKRYIPDFAKDADDGYITLTTHVAKANRINETKLDKLPGIIYIFEATTSGEFPEYNYPTDHTLTLKRGAQVMFVKNDTSHEKQFYNGKIGTVVDFEDDRILVKCADDDEAINVVPLEWNNTKYSIDETSKEIKETVIGSFFQYPLKLAWAITIHKSQGLTFEKAIIDANDAFAFGQVYVALSRCKTLEGLVLSNPISPRSIKTDTTISTFTKEVEQNQPDQQTLDQSKYDYQHTLLLELFDYTSISRRIGYLLKLLHEHEASIHENYREIFNKMSTSLKTDIIAVADKFVGHINQYIVSEKNVEKNLPLQERVTKACGYFLGTTDTVIHSVLQKTTVEIDNKAVKKSINTVLEELRRDINIKRSCLKACLNGFTVKSYLETKAKTAIEKYEPKLSQKKSEEYASDTITHPKLYGRLKTWKENKADEYNLPSYMVIPHKTLIELVTKLPVTPKELNLIKGFGKKKIDQFGEEVLAIIKEYLKEQNIETPIVEEPREKIERLKPVKIPTKQVSFDLFKSGKSIPDIMAERGFTLGTVESHLNYYLGLGEIEIEQLVPSDKIALISEYFISNPNNNLTQAKEELGDEITYGDLRFVRTHFQNISEA
jgi:hypothetical protein